jgi:hypothetical protein
MVEYVLDEVSKFTPEQKQQLDRVIAALSAEAQLLSQADLDKRDVALIEQGRLDMGENGLNCVDCHELRGTAVAKAPISRAGLRVTGPAASSTILRKSVSTASATIGCHPSAPNRSFHRNKSR